jgi:hypothetical protein
LDPRVRVLSKNPVCLWTPESESKEESDLLWTGESDRVRVQEESDLASGKAFT